MSSRGLSRDPDPRSGPVIGQPEVTRMGIDRFAHRMAPELGVGI